MGLCHSEPAPLAFNDLKNIICYGDKAELLMHPQGDVIAEAYRDGEKWCVEKDIHPPAKWHPLSHFVQVVGFTSYPSVYFYAYLDSAHPLPDEVSVLPYGKVALYPTRMAKHGQHSAIPLFVNYHETLLETWLKEMNDSHTE